MSALPDLLSNSGFADIDRHFSRFIDEFGEGELPGIAAAMLSRNMRHGHICLDLVTGPAQFDRPSPLFSWPKLETWREGFLKNRAIGGPDDGRPIVLDNAGRLYLRRYFQCEKSLAERVLIRCEGKMPATAGSADLQRLAIETALAKRFVVISGGPGTGKTTTVMRILERMVSTPGARLRIALVAPTGKAAARLQEALLAGSRDGALQDRLPKSASTLHRLLGARPTSAYFKFNADNLLPVDVVVVDEASMVPLTMMAKLFEALPERARVILLGDRDQLASVDPGAVLGDIANAASKPGPLRGSLVVLEKNYRFGNESNIFALSQAVRDGDADRALGILDSGKHPDLTTSSTPPPSQIPEQLRQRVIAGYAGYLHAPDPAEALRKFKSFRVLCAFRAGPYGVENLNRTIEKILREEKLVAGAQGNYHGMPILITYNDYGLRLYNGDIGILFLDPVDGLLSAWFVGEHGSLRRISPARLSEHEPAFAMTVHKSQGSEFDDVLFVLPDKESPLLTRELVYTGLTRARARIEVWFEEPVMRAAVTAKARRRSGLRDRLLQA
jgi:exodeoxyribonuclease V alpha subunit